MMKIIFRKLLLFSDRERDKNRRTNNSAFLSQYYKYTKTIGSIQPIILFFPPESAFWLLINEAKDFIKGITKGNNPRKRVLAN